MDLLAAAIAALAFVALLAFTGAAALVVGIDSRFDHRGDREGWWSG